MMHGDILTRMIVYALSKMLYLCTNEIMLRKSKKTEHHSQTIKKILANHILCIAMLNHSSYQQTAANPFPSHLGPQVARAFPEA